MAEDKKTIDASAVEGADTNGDGHISQEEMEMHLEFKRKELEDADAQRDAIRKMAWFALFGLLLYPLGIFVTSMFGLSEAAGLIADIAPTYFASIAVLVSAFFGADAIAQKGKSGPAKK
jgi:FtsH-binding integral membrane protein